ncbi:uncharacterized protein LOC129595453 isoform X1 [Paramacrobiotus metropolitanus]|uniref:uncharacterized protein LOC129595453 isoform X1 n=1 Tax=Paramacrobiotus metropolitanus TaxID=2943436 RepID=UPI00244560C6|nr:uncharacterized protein LOC129595453 isoform X1 [Paramacrobiotus metropolitanus]
MTENGLIVDFQCSEQRSLFISYDKLFLPSLDRYVVMQKHYHEQLQRIPTAVQNASVQVLCRPHPGAAWCWYPGRLLRRPFFFPHTGSSLVWAAVDVEGRRLTELFSADQVRFPRSKLWLAQRALPPDCFAVRECRLPDGFCPMPASKASDGLRRQLERKDVRVISILGGTVKYLQRRDAEAFSEEDVQQVCELNQKASQRLLHNEQENLGLDQVHIGTEATRKRKHPDDDAQPEVERVLQRHRISCWRSSTRWTASSARSCVACVRCGIPC